MRRLLLLLALALATLAANAQQAYPKPTGYVDDFAQVLSPEVQASLELQAAELHDKTRAQVFLVTIKSLDGNPIEQLANDLFHTWKIGEKGTDRGVLILFAIQDHKWRIEVGYGFEGILNDAKVGDIGRTLLPALRGADYDSAAQQAFSGVASVIAADAHVTLTPPDTTSDTVPLTEPETTPVASSDSSMTGCYILFFGGLLVFLAFLFLMAVLRGRSGKSSGAPYLGTSSSSTSSSSESSSSSSTDSSDSSSFSGGDGGDSGGGGASGSW